MYTRELLDHFENPRNAGELSARDAEAEVTNPACGDVLRLTAKLENRRIAQIRFQAKGCVPAMACGSALTELVAGKTVDEARTITRSQLLEFVGGVPAASEHATHLALDALASLLRHCDATLR